MGRKKAPAPLDIPVEYTTNTWALRQKYEQRKPKKDDVTRQYLSENTVVVWDQRTGPEVEFDGLNKQISGMKELGFTLERVQMVFHMLDPKEVQAFYDGTIYISNIRRPNATTRAIDAAFATAHRGWQIAFLDEAIRVCFPYATGNALDYHALLRELIESRIADIQDRSSGDWIDDADEAIESLMEVWQLAAKATFHNSAKPDEAA